MSPKPTTVADVVAAARAVHASLIDAQNAPASPTSHTDGVPIALPPAGPLPAELGATLANRRSAYRFGGQPSRAELGALLGHALGVQRVVSVDGMDHPLGQAPTAGGLATRSVYLLVHRDGALPAGQYRYQSTKNELVPTSLANPAGALRRIYRQPEFVDRAAITVALTARLDVAFAKYPIRHYRTLHVDTGIAVQNLYLVATALGLAGCAVAGFDDRGLPELLGLPETELPLALFAIGRAPE